MTIDEAEIGGSGSKPAEIRPDEILQKGLDEQPSAKDKAQAKILPPLQKVGYNLARYVFFYIVVASIVIFWVSFKSIQLPGFPQPPAFTGNSQQYKDAVETYKQAADVYQALAKMQSDRALQLFQLIVASTILPAFTAILGYIFGSRKND
ncbi:MAG TPA: hypothetical protein VKB58_02490 [Terriglobales bacterium]|nr:hypothetical protein [Terriglobales bacterium]